MRWVGLLGLLLVGKAEAAEYVVSVQGKNVGTMVVETFGARRTIDYATEGPQGYVGRTAVEVDAGGVVRSLTITGKSAVAGERFERFVAGADGGAWETSVDKGSSSGSGFYNSIGSNAEQLAILARALLKARDGRLSLLPSGQASIAKADNVDLDGEAGTLPVTLYLISGLSKRPVPIWLDNANELVARVAGVEPSTVRQDLVSSAPRLLSIQEARLAQADAALAKQAVERPSVPILIHNARLFDAVAGRMRPRTSVLIRGDRIAAVAPDGRLRPPANARKINAGGRALLPGLWDAHVHMFDTSEAVMTLASGVTSVRDMGNDGKLTAEWRRQFDVGELIGPRLFTAAVLDGNSQRTVPWAHIVKSEEEVDILVDRLATEGYSTVKLFNSLPRPLALRLIQRADLRKLLAGGHLPGRMSLSELINAGLDETTHLDFFAMQFVGPYAADDVSGPGRLALLSARSEQIVPEAAEVTAMLKAMRERRVSLDPTVTTLELLMRDVPNERASYVRPLSDRLPGSFVRSAVGFASAEAAARLKSQKAFGKALALLGKAAAAGILIVAGSDGEPGIMVARELELYVEAGLSPLQALQTATINPARRLGVEKQLGSIQPGKLADLILVDGDPERRVGDVRNLVLLMKGGALVDIVRINEHVGIKPWRGAAAFKAH